MRWALLILATIGVQPRCAWGQGSDDPFVEVAARVRSAVAAVGVYDRRAAPSVRYFGTGFVVDEPELRGLSLATNAHVVEAIRHADATEQLRVFFVDDVAVQGRSAKLVAIDTHHDVALLRFEGAAMESLELELEAAPRQGQGIGVMGYPIGTALGLEPAVHRGVIAAVVPAVLPLPRGVELTPELRQAIQEPYKLYQLDAVVFPGNSGSPVFDAQSGRVLGVINKTLAKKTREHLLEEPSGIAYAVPIRYVRELAIRASRIAPVSDPSKPTGTTTPTE